MAVRSSEVTGAERAQAGARRRGGALSAELIAILAVGVTLAGVMLTMMMVMTDSFARELGAVREELRVVRDGQGELREEMRDIREEVRELGGGQAELRERMARVEAKVDVLAGDWPPERGSDGGGR